MSSVFFSKFSNDMFRVNYMDMKKAIIGALLVLLPFIGFSQAASPKVSDLWESAGELYSKGNFSEALAQYQEIEKSGYTSEPLLYNIANCYFKERQWGKSILYYERALKLNPGSNDTQNNLMLAKEFAIDKIEELPEFILRTWIRDVNYMLSSNEWTYISLLFFALTALLLLNFRYGPSSAVRKISFFASMFSLLVGIILTLFAWSQRSSYNKRDTAIVMMPVSTVRSSPDGSGNTLFILHEGTKVEMIEQLGGWKRIELADGRQGWIPAGDLEVI